MPTTYKIDKDLGLIWSEFSGLLDFECVQTHQKILSADLDFDPSFDLLVDLRKVERVSLSSKDMATLQYHSPYDKNIKSAILTSEDIQFGVSRMYQTLQNKGDDKSMVFRSLTEARKWLGLDCG